MQLFILIIVNILVLSIFYLIISLKIEKSASEFREKKLRKEMDEIIKEFNATAARNISLLENRISILKKIINVSTDYKGIDSIIVDGHSVNDVKDITNINDTDFGGQELKAIPESAKKIENHKEQKTGNRKEKSFLHNMFSHFKQTYDSFTHKDEIKHEIIEIESHDSAGDFGKGKNINILIEKDFDKKNFRTSRLNEEEKIYNEKDTISVLNENNDIDDSSIFSVNEIELLMNSTTDKYKIISILYDKGYPIEEIAQYSGIPAGEVKLVLNLTNSL